MLIVATLLIAVASGGLAFVHVSRRNAAIQSVRSADGRVTFAGKSEDEENWLRLPECFRKVESVSVGPHVPTGQESIDIRQINRLHELERLHLSGGIQDESFEALADCVLLKELSLRTKITPVRAAALRRCRQLESIEIEAASLTDKELAPLAGLPITSVCTFEPFGRYGAPLTDACLEQFVGLPLNSLSLDGTRVTGVGLHKLHASPLKAASFSNCPFTDAGLKELATIRSIRHLFLHQTLVTDAGMAHLSGHPLEALMLQHTRVTDEGLKPLATLRSLAELNLDRNCVTDVGLQYLSSLPLRSLSLDQTGVTDAGMQYLTSIPLRELSLNQTRVSDAGAAELAKIRTLKRLHLYDTDITDAGLKQLATLPLEMLFVEDTRITDSGLEALASAPLEELHIRGTDLSRESLRILLGMKLLTKLRVSLPPFTEEDLKELQAAGVDAPRW